MSVSFPSLPTELTESNDPSVAIYLPGIVATANKLVELTGVYENVREADAKIDDAIENSEEPVAVEYRNNVELATQAQEKIDAETEAFVKEQKARKAAITKQLAEDRKPVEKALLGDIVGGVDLDKLAADYAVFLPAHIKMVKLVKDEVPAVENYLKNLPSRVRQTNGGKNTGARGWTPRFASVKLDGAELSPATFGSVVKEAGIKAADGGRKLLTTRLLATIVSEDNLSTDPNSPNVFTFQVGEKVHEVQVVGKAADDSEKTETASE